jgi:hypothetical protein
MYAMTAKKDNVVSLEGVKQSKLHDAMDQIGEDYTNWVYEQCEAHDVTYWSTTFSVLTHAMIDLQVIAESDEEGAESARHMLRDFHKYFGEAVDGLD